MRRREFITLVGGAASWPVVARAQQSMPRIGVLMGLAEDDAEGKARLVAFREGLERLDGRTAAVSASIIAMRLPLVPKTPRSAQKS